MIRERAGGPKAGQMKVNVALASDLVHEADRHAGRMGLMRTAVINLALREYLGHVRPPRRGRLPKHGRRHCMNSKAARHLDKAEGYFKKGNEFWRKAAAEILAAQEADSTLTHKQIGERFGHDRRWVARILTWHAEGSPETSTRSRTERHSCRGMPTPCGRSCAMHRQSRSSRSSPSFRRSEPRSSRTSLAKPGVRARSRRTQRRPRPSLAHRARFVTRWFTKPGARAASARGRASATSSRCSATCTLRSAS